MEVLLSGGGSPREGARSQLVGGAATGGGGAQPWGAASPDPERLRRVVFSLSLSLPLVLAIDIGGTKMACAVVDAAGELLASARIGTPRSLDAEVLFEGVDTASIQGLWFTDGTAAGTHEITGIAGAHPTGVLNVTDPSFALFNGEVLFQGIDTGGHAGLWETNGTAGGTHELTGITGASTNSLSPQDLTPLPSPTSFFSLPTLAVSNFGSSAGAGGWSSENTYPRELADVSGDGKRWLLSEYAREEQAEILDYAIEQYRQFMGTQPVAFRAGGFGANRDTLELLAERIPVRVGEPEADGQSNEQREHQQTEPVEPEEDHGNAQHAADRRGGPLQHAETALLKRGQARQDRGGAEFLEFGVRGAGWEGTKQDHGVSLSSRCRR